MENFENILRKHVMKKCYENSKYFEELGIPEYSEYWRKVGDHFNYE